MEQFMHFMRENWAWIASFSAFLIGIGTFVFLRVRALQMGVQALLRAQMIQYYNHYREKGYAPIYARESFENCWIQYERLHKNGVMQDVRTKFMALPTHDDT